MRKVPSQLRDLRQAPLLTPIDDVAELLVGAANDGNEIVEGLLAMLVDARPKNRPRASRPKPPPKELHQWLDGIVAGLTVPMTFVFDDGEWQLAHLALRPSRHTTKAGKPDSKLADAELLAIGMVRVLMDGYENRLHRCDLEDCGRYFVGDPRARYCTNGSCGSTARMRRKRKLDRQRGML